MRSSRVTTSILVAIAAASAGVALLQPAPASSQSTSAAAPAPAKVATVDILAIVERMVLSDDYRTLRDKFYADTDVSLKALVDELEGMRAKAKDMKQDSPEFAALNEAFGKKNEEFQAARRSGDQSKERFSTSQVSQAYSKSIAAARTLATSLGYSHIIASRSGELSLRSDNVAGAVQEILARPAILSPAEDDLTARLITQLGLDKVQPVSVPAGSAAPIPTAVPVKDEPKK